MTDLQLFVWFPHGTFEIVVWKYWCSYSSCHQEDSQPEIGKHKINNMHVFLQKMNQICKSSTDKKISLKPTK